MFCFLIGIYLPEMEILVLSKLNKLCAEVVPEIKRLLIIDWRPIVKPRHDYNDQTAFPWKVLTWLQLWRSSAV